MTKPSFSSKLRRETRGYHSSLAVVLFVIFVTVTVFLLILAVKGMLDNKKKEGAKTTEESPGKEMEEVKIEPQLKEETTYIVKSGDSLYSIGIKFGINWQEIAKTNNLEEPYTLTVGQELKIPKNNK